MPFPDDLLELAQRLANMEPENSRQASLRRAVSTAYYALFHLLISEATLNWNRAELRPALGRVFEHGKMKSASEDKRSEIKNRLKTDSVASAEFAVLQHLDTVVNTFIQAQQKRNDADYDNSKEWTQSDVLIQIDAVAEAFKSWTAIREESVAQAYLVSLLGKRRRSD